MYRLSRQSWILKVMLNCLVTEDHLNNLHFSFYIILLKTYLKTEFGPNRHNSVFIYPCTVEGEGSYSGNKFSKQPLFLVFFRWKKRKRKSFECSPLQKVIVLDFGKQRESTTSRRPISSITGSSVILISLSQIKKHNKINESFPKFQNIFREIFTGSLWKCNLYSFYK